MDQTDEPPKRHPGGRPKVWTDDRRTQAMDAICDRLAVGLSLRSICAEPDMPSRAEVNRWLEEDVELRNQYARARRLQADALADEVVDIADSEPDPQKARVRMDARRWFAAKLNPKKYGDQVDINHNVTDKRVGWVIDLTEPQPEGGNDGARVIDGTAAAVEVIAPNTAPALPNSQSSGLASTSDADPLASSDETPARSRG